MNRRWKRAAAVALGWLVRLEQSAAVGLLLAILITMGVQVISRYVFRSPISWSEEVARLAMIWLTFVAASFVTARRQHIAVDLFARDEPSTPGAGLDRTTADRSTAGRRAVAARWLLAAPVTNMLVLTSTLLLLIGGLRFVWRVYPVGSPSIGVSMTYWYGAASVGLALMALHSLAHLIGIEPATKSQSGRNRRAGSVQ